MRVLFSALILFIPILAKADPQGIEVVCDQKRHFSVFEHHAVIDSPMEKDKRKGAMIYSKNQNINCTVNGTEVAVKFAPDSLDAKSKCAYGLGALISLTIDSQKIINESLFAPACFSDSIRSIEYYDYSDSIQKGFVLKICGDGPQSIPSYNACITVTDKELAKVSMPLAKPLVELLKAHFSN